MYLLRRLLTSIVVAATGTIHGRDYVSFVSARDDVRPHQETEHEQPQRHSRLWNDSYIWPAPQYEVYEHLQSADGINTSRVLLYNSWDFVYDVSNSSSHNMENNDRAYIDDNNNNNTARWRIIMNAEKDRFRVFLNQTITNSDINLSSRVNEAKTPTSGDIMIPLEGIRFHISNLSETKLYYGMDESYEIQILTPSLVAFNMLEQASIQNKSNYIEITATNVFGALYGLESLKQLIQFIGYRDDNMNSDGEKAPIFCIYNNTYKFYIQDSPVYMYRGIMIDTARHFLPLHLIQETLYIMLPNKLNVLHWHMSDSQSFPYSSIRFPELARHGAYCYPECTYNASDIAMIIETAALLGIHVIVEVDLPGHSQAIGNSHPDLLSKCSNDVVSEPLNVTDDALYDFVYGLYDELTQLFSDDYIHLGGDEVSLECWESSDSLKQWMQSHNMTKTVEVLQYFEMNMLDYILNVSKKRPIVWQDLFDMNVQDIPSDVIIDVWKDWLPGSVYKTTAANYDILFSACWYLDNLNKNWWSFYSCNPRNFPNLTSTQEGHILGGHTSMWGESVDSTNFHARVWPRSSATAEVLWSGSPRNISADLSSDHVEKRLARFRCYMLAQFSVPISPISPGHCQPHGPLSIVQDLLFLKE